MNIYKAFFWKLRYHPAVQALIPVNLCMGLPLMLEENIWYLPFLEMTGRGKCFLHSELYVGFPSSEIFLFRKLMDKIEIEFDENEMLRQKQEWFCGKAGANAWQDLPGGFPGIYRHAVEKWGENDEYPIGV